ncbi:tyrosine-type recombinase/integrase [Rhizobium sp.]|uniref:tyrosine-type recombinase/integrase n=1 Tax=Rhizobium sp. TaxID=391 RepID=UPI0034C6CD92
MRYNTSPNDFVLEDKTSTKSKTTRNVQAKTTSKDACGFISAEAFPFVLFKRSGTKNWSMRYSIEGKQIRKSLETENEYEAQRRANEIYQEQKYRVSLGLSAKQYAFDEVAEEFIAKIEKEAERGERSQYHPQYWPAKIRRFFVGFFENRAIDTITSADIERYHEWRKAYWVTGPGKDIERIRCETDKRVFSRPAPRKPATISTLRGELVILRELFKQAALWHYCKPMTIEGPVIKKRTDNRRPSLTIAEYKDILALSESRIAETVITAKIIKAKDGREWVQTYNPQNVRSDRTKLHGYIQILANTGLRPTEAKNLVWGNVLAFRECRKLPLEQQDVQLQVRGKSKHGDCIPLLGILPALHLLWNSFVTEVGRDPKDTDPVFADTKGKAIGSFKTALNELFRAAGLERDHRGVKRTAYSFRHHYISAMIANGVSVHDVARNTRTSIVMIDKHYAQVSVEQIKENLRPAIMQ